MKKIVILLLMTMNFSCIKLNDLEIQQLKSSNDGKYYKLILPSGQEFQIGLTQGDSLKSLTSVIKGGKEYEAFSFNSYGRLQSKSIGDNLTKRINGRSYVFSDQTGNLESYYTYVNDTLQGRTVDYYDRTANVKAIFRFVDGKYCGKQEFDEMQNITDVTGCLLSPQLKKVGKYWEVDKSKWIGDN